MKAVLLQSLFWEWPFGLWCWKSSCNMTDWCMWEVLPFEALSHVICESAWKGSALTSVVSKGSGDGYMTMFRSGVLSICRSRGVYHADAADTLRIRGQSMGDSVWKFLTKEFFSPGWRKCWRIKEAFKVKLSLLISTHLVQEGFLPW